MNKNEFLSKKRRIASSLSSHSITSKTSHNNNFREKYYTQRYAYKCVHEEDDDIESKNEEKEREKNDKASQNTKISLLTKFL